jgi:hypothetical protein
MNKLLETSRGVRVPSKNLINVAWENFTNKNVKYIKMGLRMQQVQTLLLALFVFPAIGMEVESAKPYPFECRSLLPEELAYMVPFSQCGRVFLDGKQKKFGLSGPFSPCKLLAVKNIKTNETIDFHIDISGSTDSIVDISQEKLNFERAEDLLVVLFSTYHSEYNFGLKLLHGNHSQQDEFNFFRNKLIKQFKIDESQMQTYFFRPKNGDYGNDTETARWVVVENGGMGEFPKLYNISIAKEGYSFLRIYFDYQYSKIKLEQIAGINPLRILSVIDDNATSFKEFHKPGIARLQKYQTVEKISQIRKKIDIIEYYRLTKIFLVSTIAYTTTGLVLGSIIGTIFSKK